jgi:parallel beta-helix repeat protein
MPQGTTRCVNPGGNGSCLYASIQAAINASSPGDEVDVYAGTYTEHIIMKGGVSVYGQGWYSTTISGGYSADLPTVTFPQGITATTVLSGVQVTGGGNGSPSSQVNGGGIRIYFASPTIVNTWVYSNTGFYGGGVYVYGGAPSFSNVPAWSNHAARGGGFFIDNNASATLSSDNAGFDGTVWFNSVSEWGGGLDVEESSATVSGLRVYWNTADEYGGGVFLNFPNQVTFLLNDISFNTAVINGGGGIGGRNAQNLLIALNTINANTAGTTYASGSGGGVYLENTAGLLWSNLLVGNVVTGTKGVGGGAYITGTSPGLTLDHNRFEANSATFVGGGLELATGAVARVNANMIISNTAQAVSGVSVDSAGAVTLTNNIVVRNIGPLGYPGGLQVYGTAARVVNNTIADNSWTGVYLHTADGVVVANNIVYGHVTGVGMANMTVYTLDYNDVYSNTSANYVGVSPGVHDRSVDPAFVGSGDLLAHYHLKPTSPVIMSGSITWAPPDDIDGQARVACASMGADQIPCKYVVLPRVVR